MSEILSKKIISLKFMMVLKNFLNFSYTYAKCPKSKAKK